MNPLSKTVVVTLNSKKPAEVLLRQLKSIVNPGDRIEFLASYRPDIKPWFFAQVALMQTGSDTAVTCEERMMRALGDREKSRLEHDIAVPARRMFSRFGVQVNLQLYSGSLNRVLNRYLENGEIAVLVDPSPWLRRLKTAPSSVRDWLLCRKRQELPLLLVHLQDQFVRR